jgi:uncharacterized protein (TIGR02099 family)
MKPMVVSIAKKAGYCLAVLVILAALLVVISRAVTPYLDARRGEIESWASDLLQMPIQIEKASVSWFQYQPGVALHNVTLLDSHSRQPVLQLRTVKVFFSIPRSLWQRKLVLSGMLVSGADMVVHQNAAGELSMQGFPALDNESAEPYQKESKIRDVMGWLSVQPLIILREIDVRYTGVAGLKRLVTLHNLTLKNSDTHHRIAGQAILHQDISTEVTLAAHWRGDVTDMQTVHGRGYINVSGMSLGQWFKDKVWQGLMVKRGLVSAKIWMNWRNGGFQQIQTSVQLYDVDVVSQDKKFKHHVTRLSGDFGWKKEGNSQIFAGDDILIDESAQLWPVTNFYLKLTPDADQQLVPVMLNVGYLDIESLRNIMLAAPSMLPTKVTKLVSDIKPIGKIENASAQFGNASNHFIPTMLKGRFINVGFTADKKSPGFKNLSGNFTWDNNLGGVALQSHDMQVTAPAVFDQPVTFDQASGDLAFKQDDKQAWQLTLKSLRVLNRDLALSLSGNIELPTSLSASADLSANFTVHDVAHITRYLPMKGFSPNLSAWLRAAFLAGQVESGTMRLRGPFADFPFDPKLGTFVIEGVLNNVQLHFAPAWPDIKNINGKIKFISRQLLLDINSAQTLNVNLGALKAEIPYMGDDKPSVLTVVSQPMTTDFMQAMDYLHKSPLEKSIGKMFKNVAMSGPMALTLALTIPLENTDATTVDGKITMTNANLKLLPWQLDVMHLNGVVLFTENSTQAKDIQGELFGKSLSLNITSALDAKHRSIVKATIANNLDLKDIESWLKVSMPPILSGSTDLITTLDLAVDQPIGVHLASNLVGIKLDLPDNYSKTADQKRSFSSDLVIEENKPLKLKFNYADLVNVALILEREKNKYKLWGADIRLGKGEAEWPAEHGLYLTGLFKSVDEGKIQTYLSMSGKGVASILPLKMIDIVVTDLNFYGVKLSNARIELVPGPSSWVVTITSDELAGKLSIPLNMNVASTLTADLQRINLDKLSTGKSTKVDVKASSLPSIKFSADNMVYGGANLGDVSFETSPSATGMTINSFNMSSQVFNLDASGEWTNANKTSLQGKATSKNVSVFLSSLGFDVHNFISSTGNMNFELSWSAPPYHLSLSNMSGVASLNMGKGRIVEIDASSNAKMDIGRMLNLFSLQNIPKRLSFDFSDVFQKGYSFDTLKGDFKFSNGNATTPNMRFDGTLARVEISGRIGMVEKDFDLILSVTPYVTSSIPIAATLITGQPVVGVAAWAVNKMIGGELSKAVTHFYAVSGPWGNPSWSDIRKSEAGRN